MIPKRVPRLAAASPGCQLESRGWLCCKPKGSSTDETSDEQKALVCCALSGLLLGAVSSGAGFKSPWDSQLDREVADPNVWGRAGGVLKGGCGSQQSAFLSREAQHRVR